jgi:hypothetical protein
VSIHRRSRSHRRRVLGGAPYSQRILATAPIAYWPLSETAGAVAQCLVNSAQNATAVGVTWNNALGPDGLNGAPLFDGANDYISILTAAFQAVFNGATGSQMIWAKVANAGVWTDGSARYPMKVVLNNFNGYSLLKALANNTLEASMKAGSGVFNPTHSPFSATTWFQMACTWSDSNNDDEAKWFINGTQYGGTSANLNAWLGGALLGTYTKIGAGSDLGPASVWNGWLAHGVVWDYVLSPGTIAALARV